MPILIVSGDLRGARPEIECQRGVGIRRFLADREVTLLRWIFFPDSQEKCLLPVRGFSSPLPLYPCADGEMGLNPVPAFWMQGDASEGIVQVPLTARSSHSRTPEPGRQGSCGNPSAGRQQSGEPAHWLNKPENKEHFRGPENVYRVQRWRKAHPGTGNAPSNLAPLRYKRP